MRKKYIGYGIGILLICLIVGVLIWFQIGRNRNRKEQLSVETSTGAGISLKEYPDEIPVVNWNGLDKMYRICNTKIKSDFYNNMSECRTSFKSDVSLEEMIQTNRDDYIGMFTYYTGKWKEKGALFFKDDNYYLLSYDEYWDIFTGECCYSSYTYTYTFIYVPTPVHLDIDPDVIAAADEIGHYELDALFDHYSFDEFCRFYKRMSPNLYKIDKEKQTVTLDAYDSKKDKMRDKLITFDFKNQSVTGPDEKGKMITISKHKQPSPSEK